MPLTCRVVKASFAVLAFLACASHFSIALSQETNANAKRAFRDVITARQKELLQEAARYVAQYPDASDLDEVFAWTFETARRLGLEADAVPVAERCLSRATAPALKAAAKPVLCVGLAKAGKLKDAVAAFQDSLQFSRFGGGGEQLDLAVELVSQASLAGDHTTAKGIYETLANRLSLNAQIGEFCENRLRKLQLVNTDAPDLNLTDLTGAATTIASAKGKVLLIDFWATNCPPCLAEFPKLKQLYAEKHEEGFDVIGISLDESRETVEAFQTRAQLPWRLVCEPEQVREAREKYRVRTIPSLFLVGRDGRIAQVDLKGTDLRLAVERSLSQKTP